MQIPSVLHTQLTEAKIERLNNNGNSSDVFVRDTSIQGFGLRISRTNVKSFFVEATVRGRFKRQRKLPRLVDSSKLEFPQRASARGNVLAAGFPARRAA